MTNIESAIEYAKQHGYNPSDVGFQNIFLKADGRTPVIGDLEQWRKKDNH